MKRMSKWIAICAVCIMCSVPVMGADIAVNPKPTEIPVVEITPTETPTPTPVPVSYTHLTLPTTSRV